MFQLLHNLNLFQNPKVPRLSVLSPGLFLWTKYTFVDDLDGVQTARRLLGKLSDNSKCTFTDNIANFIDAVLTSPAVRKDTALMSRPCRGLGQLAADGQAAA